MNKTKPHSTHVVPAMSEESSGPTYSVGRLAGTLSQHGYDVDLATLKWRATDSERTGLRMFPLGRGGRRLARSPQLYRWLRSQARSGATQLIHSHGMWQMAGVYPGWAVRGTAVPLVVSPRGTFSRWAMKHGSPLKHVFWPMLQRPALTCASCFHATAVSEALEIRDLGFDQPIAVVPNGIDVPVLQTRSDTPVRILLYLGRLHPKKGVDLLVRAWAQLHMRFPGWRLMIAGSDAGYHESSGYAQELCALARDLRVRRLEFVGELRGAAKLQAYRNADIFVLPTHSENFGMTVAEALAAGTPTIVTRGAPWKGVAERACGWWIEIGYEPLVDCLQQAMSLPRVACIEMGERGHEWMQAEFSWERVGVMMSATYDWLLHKQPKPNWVHTNIAIKEES